MPQPTLQDVFDERVTKFEDTTTVEEAIETIRDSAPASEQTIYYAYVTDQDGTLESVVSMRELLNADDETPISEVARDEVVFVGIDEPVDEVAELFAHHQFMAFPVVYASSTLLGTVRASAIIEALDEEATSDDLRELLHDIEYDPEEEHTYECLSCGTTVTAVDNPMECPNCGGSLRNKGKPLE